MTIDEVAKELAESIYALRIHLSPTKGVAQIAPFIAAAMREREEAAIIRMLSPGAAGYIKELETVLAILVPDGSNYSDIVANPEKYKPQPRAEVEHTEPYRANGCPRQSRGRANTATTMTVCMLPMLAASWMKSIRSAKKSPNSKSPAPRSRRFPTS